MYRRAIAPFILLLAVTLTTLALTAGCGSGKPSTRLLESEKRLAGMYEACQKIKIVDGASRNTVTVAQVKSMSRTDFSAVLKRSNGMTKTDTWSGTPLSGVLAAGGVTSAFKELRVQAWDGYVGRVSYDIAMKPDTILAYVMNGKPLPRDDGPVRLVAASQDGFYWIRMITKIEVER
jgi:DMSO/TMAO reductase YedYZ molybdopterin-dependent catalytic subunit